MLDKAESEGFIQGVRLSNESVSINHLLIADDILFFLSGKHNEWTTIKTISEDYGRCSGQVIKYSMSVIMCVKYVKEIKA